MAPAGVGPAASLRDCPLTACVSSRTGCPGGAAGHQTPAHPGDGLCALRGGGAPRGVPSPAPSSPPLPGTEIPLTPRKPGAPITAERGRQQGTEHGVLSLTPGSHGPVGLGRSRERTPSRVCRSLGCKDLHPRGFCLPGRDPESLTHGDARVSPETCSEHVWGTRDAASPPITAF